MHETPFRFHQNQLPTNFVHERKDEEKYIPRRFCVIILLFSFFFRFWVASYVTDLLKKTSCADSRMASVCLNLHQVLAGMNRVLRVGNRRLDRASCHDSGANRAVILINERPSFLAAEMIWYFFSLPSWRIKLSFPFEGRPTIITNSNMEWANRERSVFWIRAINVVVNRWERNAELFFLSLEFSILSIFTDNEIGRRIRRRKDSFSFFFVTGVKIFLSTSR